ncbi:MAG: hypothetical protein JWO56_1796 [Acidobacteria bacterium]|nr:hypothetical protein [Acidobacteriota bacterium]
MASFFGCQGPPRPAVGRRILRSCAVYAAQEDKSRGAPVMCHPRHNAKRVGADADDTRRQEPFPSPRCAHPQSTSVFGERVRVRGKERLGSGHRSRLSRFLSPPDRRPSAFQLIRFPRPLPEDVPGTGMGWFRGEGHSSGHAQDLPPASAHSESYHPERSEGSQNARLAAERGALLSSQGRPARRGQHPGGRRLGPEMWAPRCDAPQGSRRCRRPAARWNRSTPYDDILW